jgi:DNA-binding MarR family transcriptional regulator
MEKAGDIAKKRINLILEGFDPVSSQGFVQLPKVVILNKDLSTGAKIAYAVLLKYAWEKESCFPGQERMAKDMGASRRSIVSYLKELEKVGYLKTERRGQGKTNIYYLYCKIQRR